MIARALKLLEHLVEQMNVLEWHLCQRVVVYLAHVDPRLLFREFFKNFPLLFLHTVIELVMPSGQHLFLCKGAQLLLFELLDDLVTNREVVIEMLLTAHLRTVEDCRQEAHQALSSIKNSPLLLLQDDTDKVLERLCQCFVLASVERTFLAEQVNEALVLIDLLVEAAEQTFYKLVFLNDAHQLLLLCLMFLALFWIRILDLLVHWFYLLLCKML